MIEIVKTSHWERIRLPYSGCPGANIIGLWIFVDGNVIAYHASSEDLMQETALPMSSLDSFANQVTTLDQSSEAARQLQQKIYLANQYDWHKTKALSDKQTASNEKAN